MGSRLANAKRNTFWALVRKSIELIMPFIVRTVILHTLDAEYLGLNGLFAGILKMLNLVELGFSSVVIYNMYRPIAEKKVEEVCALLNLYKRVYRIMGSVILALGLCLLPFLDSLIEGSYPEDINIHVLYLIYLFNTVMTYFLFAYKSSLLNAYQRYDVLSIVSLTCNFLMYTSEIVMILVLRNYYMYAICAPIFTIANNLMLEIQSRKMFPTIGCRGSVNAEIISNLKSKVSALVGHKLGSAVITSADNVVISAFLGLTAVAVYNNYYYVLGGIIGVIDVCMGGVVAGIGNSLVRESAEKNFNLFQRAVFILSWVVGWCATCYVCLIQDFIFMWVGEEFLYTSTTTIFLLWLYFYTWKIRAVGLRFKEAAGMWNEDFWKPYIAAAANLIINIVLVNTIGIDGVLISTIVTMVFVNLPWETAVLFKGVFKISPRGYYFFLIKAFTVTVVTGGITLIVCSLFPQRSMTYFLLKGVVCFTLPNLLMAIIWIRNPLFYEVVRMLKSGK